MFFSWVERPLEFWPQSNSLLPLLGCSKLPSLCFQASTPAFAFPVPLPEDAFPLSGKLLFLHDPIPGSKTNIYFFINYLLITHYVPSTVVDAGGSVMEV